MRIAGAWLSHPGTQDVCRMLTAAGFRALFVGGCVRDALIGRPVGDIDIATDARPEDVVRLAGAAGLRAVPTGIDHGTVTVIAEGRPHEITTFRRDIETDGRHATVAFSTDVAEDAARRDFTMNALYATPDGEIVDPLGGLADLEARRLRFVGAAEARIEEDYLRILRFFRFHAWYGDPAEGPDPDALAAIAVATEGLDGLSRERVGQEIRKLLSAPDPSQAVALMRQTGVLSQILPGAEDRALAPLIHLEQAPEIMCPPDPMRRLAVLGPEAPGPALRLSKDDLRGYDLMRDGMASSMSAAELGYRFGRDRAESILLLRWAIFEMLPQPEDIMQAGLGARAKFPVTARDLMPGYSGPALGARLAELEHRWIASGFALTREQLCADGDG
ncbi:CCA tRNA nucleotidyltransferase [Pseudooceanicola sp. C21-150M6]|uniref:CCA tRNA nucleotidyltransferase n=1 Tax=Pseudooceanicola sp. C21-150M6 TaxID=3434355 RepID=UPI003D7F2AA0